MNRPWYFIAVIIIAWVPSAFGDATNAQLSGGAVGDGYFQQSLTLIKSGEYDAALLALEYERRLHPDDPVLLLYTGYCLYKRGDADSALQYLDDAARLNRRMPVIYLIRGEIYAAKGDIARARESYESALDYDPDIYIAHRALATMLMGSGDPSADEHYVMCFQLRQEPLENYLPKAPNYTITRRSEFRTGMSADRLAQPAGSEHMTASGLESNALTVMSNSMTNSALSLAVTNIGYGTAERIERIPLRRLRRGKAIEKVTQVVIVSLLLSILVYWRNKRRLAQKGTVLKKYYT